jgi:hypothetical protein
MSTSSFVCANDRPQTSIAASAQTDFITGSGFVIDSSCEKLNKILNPQVQSGCRKYYTKLAAVPSSRPEREPKISPALHYKYYRFNTFIIEFKTVKAERSELDIIYTYFVYLDVSKKFRST